MQPETRYAKSGDTHVAYQVVGDGPRDLVWVGGWFSHVEVIWELPSFSRLLRRLSTFSRLIVFDKRGTGLSDPVPLVALPSLEEWMDDVRAVMDTVDSERAALLGSGHGGLMAMVFAATHPARTAALILDNASARFLRGPDYPWGMPPEALDREVERRVASWGTGIRLEAVAPTVANDEQFRRWWGRLERLSASPGAAAAMWRMVLGLDVRHVLSTIRVPTLVLHRAENRYTRVDHGRFLAQHIPGAKYVELPGADHFPWTADQDAYVAEIEEFLTGVRQGPEPDRVLATVLFTDIVGSTERAVAVGDQRWRDVLDSYYTVIRQEVGRFRGREVETAGDGFLATFDGPARAIRCACAIADAVARLGIAIRAGLHTGECEVMGDKLGGIAVHIGARVAAKAGPGEVVVSSTVKDLVAGSGLRFADRGVHTLKGVPGKWRLFAVER